jgi:predicted nucleic-acid-binding protein
MHTILRFLLKDNQNQYEEAVRVFDSNEKIYVPSEVIAEVVYVLQKVYLVSREEISSLYFLSQCFLR